MTKQWIAGVLGTAVLVISANTVIFADDSDATIVETDDYGDVLIIEDGRLNAFDVAAPVAVYYTTATVPDDEQGFVDVVTGIQVLAIDPTTNNGVPVLEAGANAIAQLINGEVETISAGGFALNYADGWFWVTAPADAEGKVYSFTWENNSFAA